MLNSVFWDANILRYSDIFYSNISESQTYSKYYHCQANILLRRQRNFIKLSTFFQHQN